MGGGLKIGVRVVLLIVWIIVIFVLTGYPSLTMPSMIETPVDKLYHAIIFFILGFLEYPILKKLFFFLVGGAIVFFAEFQQLMIPGRDFEIADIIAGIFGLLIAFIVFHWRNIKKDALSKT